MTDRDTSRDVAIVGMACRFAGADDVDQLWDNLVEGKTSFGPVPPERWNHEDFHTERFREHDKTYVERGAFIDDVDSFGSMHFGIAPRRVEVMDPQHRMVLEAVRIAMLDAGFERSDADLETMGTFLGVSTSEYRNFVTSRTTAMMMASGQLGDGDGVGESIAKAVQNVAPISAFSMPGTLLNMAAANVANHWKLGGPAYTVDAACASSLVAVHDAVTHIRAGICKTAIAGGVYLNLTPEAIIGFSRIGAISQKGACRPFDAEADGFLQGDGCGVVVLKSYEQAVKDGDRIYATILGSGTNNDAGSSSGPMAPSLFGQKQAVRRAFADAGVPARTVEFVSCHGTATPVGDPVEVTAIREVLSEEGDLDHPVYLGSVKANVGHTMSAAGVAGLIHATLALYNGRITPQAGFETPHPDLGLDDGLVRVPTEVVEWKTNGHPRRAGVSAFGFGGTNCHLVVEEAPAAQPLTVDEPQTVVLSAESRQLLADYADLVANEAEEHSLSLGDVAYTLSATRKTDKARLAVVAESTDELVAELRRAAKSLRTDEEPGMLLGPNTFWGAGDDLGIGFMFPGQGAQRVGLFASLYERHDGFRQHLDRLSDAVEETLGASIADFLYPDAADEDAEERLKATEICQPVMAAVGLALARFLADLGVTPAVTLGHSLGEFVAAAAGGLMSDDDAIRFVADRGRMMAALKVDDAGAMAAVMGDAETVQAHLVDGAVIANLNHPQQTVVSGTTNAVEKTAKALTDAGIKVTTLRVSHAFHSPVVADVTPALTGRIGEIEFSDPSVPVVSAISGETYRAANAAKTFVDHTTSPVDFISAMSAAREHASVFLEVGAGTTLTAFARGVLGDELAASRSLGSTKDDDLREFYRGLAMLAAAGAPIAFERLFARRSVVSLPAAPLQRSKRWVIREREIPLDVPEGSKRGEVQGNSMTEDTKNTSPASPSASSDLVALFREQNEILRQHAAIIASQTAALGGHVDPQVLANLAASASAKTPAAQSEHSSVGVDAPVPAKAPKAAAARAAVDVAPAEQPKVEAADYGAMVLEAVAGVSAFPADSLALDQQLATDLGFDSLMFVDLGAELMKALPGLQIPQDAFDQSTTIGDVVSFLEDNAGTATDASTDDADGADLHRWLIDWAPVRPSALDAAPFAPEGTVAVTTHGPDAAAKRLAETLEARGTHVVLVDLDDSHEIGGATAIIDFAHRNASWDVEHLVELRQLAAALLANGAPIAFATVSTGEDAAMRGALRGFSKSLAREWSDARVVHIDADAHIADTVAAELDQAARHVEVRWRDGVRMVPAATLADEDGGTLDIQKDDVVAITGGARGIGLLCATALAEKTDARLVLIGRSAEEDVAKELKSLRKAAKVDYIPWDVTEAKADAFGKHKPTVLIHAAGVIRDAAIEDKTDDDVRLVAGVKVDGLRNVLDAAGDGVRLAVGFGSWSGRFGNARQTDYAAANDAVTEVMRDLAGDGVRALNIDWPIWTGSTMADSIPESLQTAMKARGVTFLSPAEGVDAFLSELGQTTSGEVIFGRQLPRREAPYRSAFTANVDRLPYVAHHVLREAPVIPFATALDWLGTAAASAGDWTGPMVLRNVQLFKPVELTDNVDVELSADVERSTGTAQLVVDGDLAYRANISFEAYDPVMPQPQGSAVTPSLDLDTFYAKRSFHGPKIQGIAGIEGIAPEWVIGRVKTSTPAQLLETKTDRVWTIDPLVIDGAMQLVLYHLQSLHGFGAYPTAIDEYVQLRPFVGKEVTCTMALDEWQDGNIVGTIAFEDDEGVAAVMTRLRAKEYRGETGTVNDEPEMDVDPQYWDIARFPEVEALEQRLQMADLIGIRNPYFWPHDGPARNTAMIEGREMINFSSYNYCGFSGHPEVTKAAQDAAGRYGTSVSASRIASGQIPLHQELEDAIANFIGTEASLVFSAGHMTNETTIGHMFGKKDLIIHDSLAHNSILTGAELSGAKRMQFPHNDYEALDRTLAKLRGNFEKVVIIIEGVYSMDGDIPELQKFIDVKRKYKCLLYVDEAHSMGVIGDRGAGIADHFGIDPMDVDMWMGTLSKSFASCGGYITGSKSLINYLKYTAPAFVFSAGISPANAGAALAAVQRLNESPEIPRTLQKRSKFFLELCEENGIDVGMSKDSAVVPAIVGNSIDCLKLSQRLAERGVNVQPIVYPAVEDESSRLRFFLSATHTEDELRRTVDILTEELANVRSGAAAE